MDSYLRIHELIARSDTVLVQIESYMDVPVSGHTVIRERSRAVRCSRRVTDRATEGYVIFDRNIRTDSDCFRGPWKTVEQTEIIRVVSLGLEGRVGPVCQTGRMISFKRCV